MSSPIPNIRLRFKRVHAGVAWRVFALVCGAVIGCGCNAPRLWPLCLAAVVGLCVGVLSTASASARASAWVVACAAIGWQGSAMWWAIEAVRNDGALTWLWAALVMGVLVGSQTLWWLALWLPARWIACRIAHGGQVPAVRIAFAWGVAFAAADSLRQLGWAGDGYASLAVALVDAPGVAGLLPMIGAQGMSLLVMTLACACALILIAPRSSHSRRGPDVFRRHRMQGAIVVASIAVCIAASGPTLASIEWTVPTGAPLQAIAIQGNADTRAEWSLMRRDEALASIESAMARLPRGGMVVTPETYLAEAPPQSAEGRWADLLDLVDRSGVHLLLGMPQRLRDTEGNHVLNAVVHLAPQRQSLYAKERLVPGFEYLPWPQSLGPLYRRVFDGVREGQMAAPAALTAPLYVAGATVGMSICYEQSFALTMAERARDATLLVGASEDGWIQSAAYRAQMLSTVRLRAMEFGKPFLRVSNGGSTVSIDAHGGVLAEAPPLSSQLLAVTLMPREGRTPYQQGAVWLAAGPVALWIAGIVAGSWRHAVLASAEADIETLDMETS